MTNDETPATAPDRFTIEDMPASTQYELRDAETTIGFAEYHDRGDSRLFTHTVVDSSYGGQGLGTRLARHVLEDAVAQGKRIVPICPFIAAYLKRHPEYEANVDWPDAVAG
ncbi:GNAT family N-acetyltransferase [Leifsonia bigeumensis]|uniref:GNAT family N-acetyltransferase n=1 Tax=Leifsonella bigeumensis TaxID=433643 RepID=A0ABP7FUL8_9MICO